MVDVCSPLECLMMYGSKLNYIFKIVQIEYMYMLLVQLYIIRKIREVSCSSTYCSGEFLLAPVSYVIRANEHVKSYSER